MTKKVTKPEPANLTTTQREEIKKQIVAQFPVLSLFGDEIDFLIEEYNKDKKYVTKLMKAKNPVQAVVDEAELEKKLELIKVVKADTDEWREIVDKMDRAKDEFLKINPDEEKSAITV